LTESDLLFERTEIVDLIRLESKIQRGLETFMEVGSALMEINERKLYRHTHKTFAVYCREKWGMSKSYAYDLISGAKTAHHILSGASDVQRPETESQMRILLQLPLAQRIEAWQRATATAPDGKITADHVQAVVDQMLVDQPAIYESKMESNLYVYAISESDQGPTKIGFAADVEERMATLQIGNPRQLNLAGSFSSLRAPEVEKATKRKLQYCQIRGEWYAIDPLSAIRTILSCMGADTDNNQK